MTPDAAVAVRPDAFAEGPASGRLRLEVGHCLRCADAAWHGPPDPSDRPAVTSPDAAAELLVPAFAGADRERCIALLLDTKHRLLEQRTISIGSIDHTFMAPREIMRDALLANASAVVLGHNHPSGDPEPSRDDELVTQRLNRAAEVVGVDLLDHLVIAGSRWVSLARRGVI